MSGCEDEEKRWMDKLQEAADIWGEMVDADKTDEILDNFLEHTETTWEDGLDAAENAADGNWEDLVDNVKDLVDDIQEMLDDEEEAQQLADEQNERNEEYQDALGEAEDLLDELCFCERGEAMGWV